MKVTTAIFLIGLCFANITTTKLFILIGPSGVGKTTLANKLIATNKYLEFLITHTTRAMRPGEIDGIDYHFISKQEFAEKEQKKQFITSTTIYGNSYGICKDVIQSKMAKNVHLISCLNAEVGQKIKDFWHHDVVTIFIAPPTLEILQQRLSSRHSEDAQSLQKRFDAASFEMQRQNDFDYNIVNDNLDQTTEILQNIFLQESKQ